MAKTPQLQWIDAKVAVPAFTDAYWADDHWAFASDEVLVRVKSTNSVIFASLTAELAETSGESLLLYAWEDERSQYDLEEIDFWAIPQMKVED